MTVAAILRHKGYGVARIVPTATVAEAVSTLDAERIGALVVSNSTERLLGIVSERDVIRALAAHGAGALQMTVGALMTRDVTTTAPEATVVQAMELMTTRRIRHIPVMDDGTLVGIVSIGDVVKARIMEAEQEVDSLKAYVAGS